MKVYTLILILALLSFGCKKDNFSKDNQPNNTIIIDTWGDSLTAGDGGEGTTYPNELEILTGLQVNNYGASGETSTEIKNRMLASNEEKNRIVIIWAGRNNFDDFNTVLNDIDSMVESIGHDRFIVMGIINQDREAEHKGGIAYKKMIELNTELESRYQSHYLDIRNEIVAAYDSNNIEDKLDFSNDVTPISKRADDLHLNAVGYKYVGQKVYDKLRELSLVN